MASFVVFTHFWHWNMPEQKSSWEMENLKHTCLALAQKEMAVTGPECVSFIKKQFQAVNEHNSISCIAYA